MMGTSGETSDADMDYLQTHPWINFKGVDLRRAPYIFWMLLGEAWSKCQHIAGVPLQPETAQDLHTMYLVKGARATTAIEGNTLSEEEVSKLVLGTLKLPPSKEYLGREVKNIVRECNQILDILKAGDSLPLSSQRIKELNERVLDGLELEQGVEPGRIRTYSVGVARHRGAPAQDCEYLLDRLCQWLNDMGPSSLGPQSPILKAILAHLYLAWIHPFGDGNGRTARLVEFQILVSSGVPSPAAHLLSNHYNETRSEYYRQLDRASQASDGPMEFFIYALQGFVDGLRDQIARIRDQQWQVTWENYVHDMFRDKNTPADNRRRHLVLDLSAQVEPVPRSKVASLSPRLAAEYATKTEKTMTRDVNALESMGLVLKTSAGIKANKRMILAFLPVSGPMSEPTDPQMPMHLR